MFTAATARGMRIHTGQGYTHTIVAHPEMTPAPSVTEYLRPGKCRAPWDPTYPAYSARVYPSTHSSLRLLEYPKEDDALIHTYGVIILVCTRGTYVYRTQD